MTRSPSWSAVPPWGSAGTTSACSRPAGPPAFPHPHTANGSCRPRGGGTSGGPSLIWAQPSYQLGVVPTALATAPGGNRSPGLVRSEPDIAADADQFTGFAVGLLVFPKNKPPKFTTLTGGGTSIAAPLVAGIVADAQQGQHTAFGFTDPVLYRLNGTPALHDILPSTSRTPGLFRGEVCYVPPVDPCPVPGYLRRPEPPWPATPARSPSRATTT